MPTPGDTSDKRVVISDPVIQEPPIVLKTKAQGTSQMLQLMLVARRPEPPTVTTKLPRTGKLQAISSTLEEDRFRHLIRHMRSLEWNLSLAHAQPDQHSLA